LFACEGELEHAGCDRRCCHIHAYCRAGYEIWTLWSVICVTGDFSFRAQQK
jgi:hypothetical protein